MQFSNISGLEFRENPKNLFSQGLSQNILTRIKIDSPKKMLPALFISLGNPHLILLNHWKILVIQDGEIQLDSPKLLRNSTPAFIFGEGQRRLGSAMFLTFFCHILSKFQGIGQEPLNIFGCEDLFLGVFIQSSCTPLFQNPRSAPGHTQNSK